MMRSGSAVQTNGLGLRLCSIAACRSTSEWKAPRCKRRRVSVAKNPSTALGPGARGRGEMEHPAGMPREPGAHLGMLVDGIVVEDRVDQFAGRDRRFDPV
jgi:hypothetical protein